MLSCVAVVYCTLGQSQAMRAVFIEDILALVPAIAFLISARYRWRTPNERFPYGFHHTVSIGFITSAVALLSLGVLVLIEALRTLVTREHRPSASSRSSVIRCGSAGSCIRRSCTA